MFVDYHNANYLKPVWYYAASSAAPFRTIVVQSLPNYWILHTASNFKLYNMLFLRGSRYIMYIYLSSHSHVFTFFLTHKELLIIDPKSWHFSIAQVSKVGRSGAGDADWIDRHIHSLANLGGPLLGSLVRFGSVLMGNVKNRTEYIVQRNLNGGCHIGWGNYMDVSKNRGTPKRMVYNGKPH